MGEAMAGGGLRLISGGTDTHLLLVDLRPAGLTGKVAEALLEELGMTCNKNAIPNDPESPFVTSGIRVGSPAFTSRGFGAEEARLVGALIARSLFERENPVVLGEIRAQVEELLARYPLYPGLVY
jgi:glycine hydroxymethyltransferase